MKYTIKQWFERVADPKLREELLANMRSPNEKESTLYNAILSNIAWDKTLQGHSYWRNIYKKAQLNQIELLPKIKKSDLLERIEKLEKQQASDHVMIMDILAKLESNSFNIDGLYTKFESLKKDINEPINLNENPHFGGIQLFDNKEKKIVFDYTFNELGQMSIPELKPNDFKNVKEVCEMFEGAYIFKGIHFDIKKPNTFYIGHYE